MERKINKHHLEFESTRFCIDSIPLFNPSICSSCEFPFGWHSAVYRKGREMEIEKEGMNAGSDSRHFAVDFVERFIYAEICVFSQGVAMPVIKPVSDLRNYTNVLHDIAAGFPVFLTKNGRGRFVMLDIGDYEKTEASIRLFTELAKGRKSGEQQGWLTVEEVEAALDIAE